MFPLRDNIPSQRVPVVNWILICVNVIVFATELKLDAIGQLEPFFIAHGLIAKNFLANPGGEWPTLFTSMFLHGGWAHILSNMWFLFIFGDNVEDKLGHGRFIIFYVLCGLGAAGAQVFFSSISVVPMIGASGAIAGVLGAYFLMFPGARVLTFFIIIFFVRFIEIPAFIFLGLWFVSQTIYGVGSLTAQAADKGSVAFWAHAGGFASGFALINLFRKHR